MPMLRQQPLMGLGETDDLRDVPVNVAKDFTGSARVGRSPPNIPGEYSDVSSSCTVGTGNQAVGDHT